MKKAVLIIGIALLVSLVLFSGCTETAKDSNNSLAGSETGAGDSSGVPMPEVPKSGEASDSDIPNLQI